jgi:hypothetical protein
MYIYMYIYIYVYEYIHVYIDCLDLYRNSQYFFLTFFSIFLKHSGHSPHIECMTYIMTFIIMMMTTKSILHLWNRFSNSENIKIVNDIKINENQSESTIDNIKLNENQSKSIITESLKAIIINELIEPIPGSGIIAVEELIKPVSVTGSLYESVPVSESGSVAELAPVSVTGSISGSVSNSDYSNVILDDFIINDDYPVTEVLVPDDPVPEVYIYIYIFIYIQIDIDIFTYV